MSHTYKKAAGLLAVVVALSVFLLAGCGAKKDTATSATADTALKEQLKLKIADFTTNPTFRVAVNQGFFKKNGIDAELVTFATPAEGVNALFIKQVDVAWGADFPLLNAASKGDYAIIASIGTGYDEASASQWRLLVSKDIKSAADLKGKKLSTLRGTFISYLWDSYLGENQLTGKDVSLIGQGGFDEMYVALKKGEVDAVWLAGSTLLDKFLAIDGVHVLTDMSKTKVRTGGGVIVPGSFLKEHPSGAVQFLQAIEDASVYIKAHPDDVGELLFKEVKLPKEAVVRDLPFNTWNISFPQKAYDSLINQKKYMVENGIIKDDYDLKTKLQLDAITKAFPDRVTYKK